MRRVLVALLSRGGLGYVVMGLIVLSGAVWSFGALVEIGNTATTEQSLTTLPVPYAGILFAGSVDLFIFYGYLKCYGPVWQIALSVFHILVGLATSLWFQWQHSKGNVDPVQVSVIPALAVAVSLDTWVVSQLVDWFGSRRDAPTAVGPPAELPTFQAAEPTAEPVGRLVAAQSRTNGVRALRPNELRRVQPLVDQGMAAWAIHQRTKVPYKPLLAHMSNGDRPKVDA